MRDMTLPRNGPLRLAGGLMVLAAIQPALTALDEGQPAPASFLALAAVWLILGAVSLWGSRAALLPGLVVALLLVGPALWRLPVLLPAAGPVAFWGALLLPALAGLACIIALVRRR